MLTRRYMTLADARLFGALRYKVFVEALRWVEGDAANRLELNGLEDEATHIGLFSEDQLVGYVRLIPGGRGGMLIEQPSFLDLAPDVPFGSNTVEVSRFCVDPDYPNGQTAIAQLLQEVWSWITTNHFLSVCLTTSDAKVPGLITVDVLLKWGFKVLKGPHEYVPGVGTYLVELIIGSESDALKAIVQLPRPSI